MCNQGTRRIGEDETLQTDRRYPWKIGGEDKMLQRDKQTDTTLRGSQLWSKNVMTSSFWEGQLLQSLDVWKISCSGTIWRFPILWIEIKVGREGICQQKLFFQLWFPQKPLTVEWFGISKSPGWIVVNSLGFSICFSCNSMFNST